MKYRFNSKNLKATFKDAYQRCIDTLMEKDRTLELVVKEQTRNDRQNRKAHAMLGDISRQLQHCGQTFSLDVWKRLTMATWMREENENPMMIPALDGNGVDVVYERTSKLTVEKMASYISWLDAFGSQAGVRWTAPAWLMEGDK